VAVSKAIRARFPTVPIAWGGYFPTLCPEAALAAPYVDYVVRGQGEVALREWLETVQVSGRDVDALASIDGLSWRRDDGEVVHNRDRAFSAVSAASRLPYDRLEDPGQYLGRTYLGHRTLGYQAALGCRFRCTFCGVAAMFGGKTALAPHERVEQDLTSLRDRYGVDAIQFYDHNFFDREVDMLPLLEVLARLQLPWWCYARSDALINLSATAWKLVRASRLRMAYIGAESPSDAMLHDIRKGTRSNQTLEAVEVCHRHGVIPELSFMVAPPHDPEGETEQTFEFIRSIKREYPATEIMIYVYTPLPPQRAGANVRTTRTPLALRDTLGRPVEFPTTPDQWAEPHWVDYWCHHDAPWLSRRLHRRIVDFTTVLGCRFPTVTDIRSPPWGKQWLRTLASWRYRLGRYERPWELDLSRKFIRLHDPRASSL
jgi:anaerobic magnesium-protoporphyrin IX monomethyl ester cyclase